MSLHCRKINWNIQPVPSLRDLVAEAESERKRANQNESRPIGTSRNLQEER